MFRRSTPLFVAAGLALGASGAWAQNVDCGDTITGNVTITSGTVTTGPCAGTAITVDGPATLDLNGFVIQCTDTIDDIGIDIVGTGAVVKNGGTQGCFVGVQSTSGGGVHELTLLKAQSAVTGFNITTVSNKLTQVIAQGGPGNGFTIGGTSNKLVGCDSISSAVGFVVSGDSHRISTCTALNNSSHGFDIAGNFINIQRTHSVANASGFIVAGNDNKILKSASSRNTNPGFYVTGTNNKLLQNTSDRDGGGFEIDGSEFKLSDNIARETLGIGFHVVVGGTDHKLVKNISIGATTDGFVLAGTAKLIKNTAIDASDDCFTITSGGNLVKSNVAKSCADGFTVIGPDGDTNELKSNVALGNSGNGISVDVGALTNEISSNTAYANGTDLNDANVSCGGVGGNVWEKNHFGTSKDACIN